MNNSPFGNPALLKSKIGIGLAALGRPGYINLGHKTDLKNNYDINAMEENAHLVIDRAWQLGVRYFDAARSYGRAEQFLGSWLRSRKINPKDVTVGSKWGYTYTADWQIEAEAHEIKEHSIGILEKQWQETQKHLGEWLNLYQIHSATLESSVLENAAVHKKLFELKNSTAIGLSLSGTIQAETLKAALKIERKGIKLFDSVQATWNLLEPSAGDALKEAHENGLVVIIKEALANGRLTDRNVETDFAENKKLLLDAANKQKSTIDSIALAAVLKESWVDIVLSGAATNAHLESNLEAFKITDLPEIKIAENPKEYWAKRSSLSWN